MIPIVSTILFSFFDAETMVRGGGLLIICLAVFAQTGLFFCFFVPSGIFLFVGGMFVATGQLHHAVVTVCVCAVLASVAGGCAGYWFGYKTGPLLYKRKDSRFYRRKYLNAADAFYKKYGQFAVTLGMLFPITRTFAPIVAGIVRMNFSRFILFVFIGSALWIPVFIIAGYLMGSIPAIKEYLYYIMAAIILIVTIPAVTRIIKEFRKAAKDSQHNNETGIN
ncbi:DedA family protein [Panacibacter ginsenosidivorans]|uniref:DedA family protein n=1 Tax=Panacibacter ginsenosidivorans TaxID=1813871 RepID=A0A5B8VCY0_9BACT|nr:DedA family protein [Panacibacter ginsenosidivorans]QEC69129.1 DedA family protein [Panacibacter ginsenosidivorans]